MTSTCCSMADGGATGNVGSLLSAFQKCLNNGTGAPTTWVTSETMLVVSRSQLSLPPALAAIAPRAESSWAASWGSWVWARLRPTHTDDTVEPVLICHSMPAQPDRGHPGRAHAQLLA